MSTSVSLLHKPLRLPCGAILFNRLAKAALSETVGTSNGDPTTELIQLYKRWSGSGAGLLITGNVMIDRRSIYEVGNIVIADRSQMKMLKNWAEVAKAKGSQIWMQLNHPGRRAAFPLWNRPVAPSSVPIRTAGWINIYPTELTDREIHHIINQFSSAALIVKEAGFSGVQLHVAHGFLMSQFLLPRYNLRTDRWGGTPKNRLRLILCTLDSIRQAVGEEYPLSVKLSAADFLRANCSENEVVEIISAIDSAGVDLVEMSGGSYEKSQSPSPMEKSFVEKREIYFDRIIPIVRDRLVNSVFMITGGFRSIHAMESALARGVDVIGLARPLVIDPEFCRKILSQNYQYYDNIEPKRIGVPPLDYFVDLYWHVEQIHRMANGREPDRDLSPWHIILKYGVKILRQFLR